MLPMTFEKLASILGLETSLSGVIEAVSTDSRVIDEKTLYVPLKGERFDGHDFIASALDSGAPLALSEGPSEDVRVWGVPSTLEALGKSAHEVRCEVNPLVIGVTGSVGKTTTKDMTAAVLSTRYPTHKTAGNFNNEIGLPKTLLDLTPEKKAAVIEMGMSHKGEISRLTRIASPDVAIINNIGSAHIEYLGSREGIRDAKLEIAEGLKAEGTLILNGDEPLLTERIPFLSHKVITFGIEDPASDIHAENLVLGEETSVFDVKGVHFFLPVAGKHNVYDALAAIAAGVAAGVTIESAAKALDKFTPTSAMRQNIYLYKGIRFIEDCYNAGPESMAASIAVAEGIRISGKKVAVLGVMRELGERAPEYHRAAAEKAAGVFDAIHTFGDENGMYQKGAPSATAWKDREALAAYLAKELHEGDLVLFKGSRLNYLEKVVSMLKEAL
ncbi:MAG: UDP-N-acetylmuramoyl-tripeptide--D-alanyl-D-alanine ligase [Clostridia bacterium]|nr:UDP-N-acetylmuramoyl-tripeptide--D-alanyl-D-alanine ligase [Clostridia bacterium]